MTDFYTIDNAKKFKWSSVSGDINPERRDKLDQYLVGKKILDAGCGGGAYVEYLAQQGFDVTGIDKHQQFLELAREKGRLGTYLQGDITHFPFSDQTFDCSYCFDVLEHVDDYRAILELARVTKYRLILAVPKEDQIMHNFNLTFLHYQDKTHLRNYTEESLQDLCRKVSRLEIQIIPELAVPLPSLVDRLVDFHLEEAYKREIEVLSRESRIEKLIRAFTFRQKKSPPTFENSLTARFAQEVSCPKIYTGLVAIVELEH
jgi:ubiquinone/menaquinone biosynthesis C-methylase UbiE